MNPDLNLFYPLSEFYEQLSLPLPEVTQVEGQDVPEPYRSLLVHQRDMTPTLVAAYGRHIHLRLLRKNLRKDVYARQIVLEVDGSGEPVVFGAIKIYLEFFPQAARKLVLEGIEPLGAILESEKIEHSSRPYAYLQVHSDAMMNREFGLSGTHLLYGRRNALWNASGDALARVVEILPPQSRSGD